MSKNIPTNKALYARVKAEAKKKFDRWPSAYGSAWLVREYKKRGGGYRKAEEGMEVPDYGYGGGMNYADYAYMYGGEDTDMMEYAKGGGIPERYKNKGFTKVGAKKKSTRPGKKWMVLAKKGDKYKIVHGGDSNMKDFKQHGSNKRKKRFWDRMGGRDSAKAKDPFSPLYWHKRFGTWEEGGEIFNEDSMDFYQKGGEEKQKIEQLPYKIELPAPSEKYKRLLVQPFEKARTTSEWIEAAENIKNSPYSWDINREPGRQDGPDPELTAEYIMSNLKRYAKGGTNNPGFRALPPEVQQNILDNMGIGGECYACGGQKKYQLAGQTLENPFTQEELDYMEGMYQQPDLEYLPYPNDTGNLPIMYPDPTIELDEVVVTDTRFGGLKPKPIPDMTPEMSEPTLMPVTLPERVESYIEDPEQEEKEKPNRKLQWAMGRIAMANAANQFMENIDDRKQEAKMRQNLLTDNFVPMITGNDRGDYDINTGIFRPDDYVPTQFQSFMAKGGQIGMVDEDILQELIAAGADIEILD